MDLISENKKKILLVIIISTILIIGGLYYHWGTKEKEERYSYEVKITLKNADSATLIIPFPVTGNETNGDIFNNLRLEKGNCDYEIIQTNHGKGLRVNVTPTSKLLSEGNIAIPFENFNLSLGNETNPDHPFDSSSPQYWIYTSENCSLSLEYLIASRDGSYSQSIIRIESNLKPGWASISADIESHD